MRDSLLQIAGLLALFGAPAWLLYQGFCWIREMRAMARSKPQMDKTLVGLQAQVVELRKAWGDAQREIAKLDTRVSAWEAWARKVVKK